MCGTPRASNETIAPPPMGASTAPDLWGSGRHTNQKQAIKRTSKASPIRRFTYLTTRAAREFVIGENVNNDNRIHLSKGPCRKSAGIRLTFGLDLVEIKMGAFPGYFGARPPT